MGTCVPGFQSSFFASFCTGQISHQQQKGYFVLGGMKEKFREMALQIFHIGSVKILTS